MSENQSKIKEYWDKYSAWQKARKEKREANKPETIQEHIWSWTKTIVGAVLVVMVINGLLVASFVVPTGSMENTVMTGDFLFVNKFIYGPSTPQVVPFINMPLPFYKFPGVKTPERGDVIVFIYPGDRDEVKSKEFQYYLKRCVAVAGDTLQVMDKKILVNHQEFPLPVNAHYDPLVPETPAEKWVTFPIGRGFTRNAYGPIRIPKKGDMIDLTSQNWREWEWFIRKEGHEISANGDQILIDNKPSNKYQVKKDYCFGIGDNRDHSLDSRFWGFIPVENVVGTPLMVYWSWESRDEMGNEYGLFDKLSKIRWSRIFNFIK
jgi:signal peptidase I